MTVIMPSFSGHLSTFIEVHPARQQKGGSLKPKERRKKGPLNWMKGPGRWHPEKKVKHSEAGLKSEGLCGNMEGGDAFICKIQSSQIPVSLCVARRLCKHMNKNKKEQEKGIYLAHAYSNGAGEGLIHSLHSSPEQ